MKRVLTFLAIMLLPLSVWAMTPVTDSDLADVTGQAGVNINADLLMNVSIGTMAWGDATGLDTGFAKYGWGTGATNPGYVGITNFNITNLRIKARETDSYGTGYTAIGSTQIYDGVSTYTYSTWMLKPITIDVCRDGSALYGGATFVRFGLGSLEITMDAMSMNVALGQTGAALNEVLGSANLGPMEIYINPVSRVDIFTRSGVGVNLNMLVVVDQFNMSYLSWGDSDGAADNVGAGGVTWFANAGAGYVGLDTLVVGGPITIDGEVRIDVATASGLANGIYAFKNLGALTTVVHISFPENFKLNVTGPITANVKLGNVAGLNNTGAGVLGDIYISSFGVEIANSSWVDIWAH